MFARLIRAVALLLFAGQAIVAQAHAHAPQRWPGPTVAQTMATSAPSSPQRDDPFSCAICREVAHAGAYLTPDAFTLAVPRAVDHWSPATVSPTRWTGRPSHAWQSRAPPMSLPA